MIYILQFCNSYGNPAFMLTDDVILAKYTAQITAAEKDRSRSPCAADAGFLPPVQRRSGNYRLKSLAAITCFK